VTTRQAPPGGPLRGFLDDWRIHLRAKNQGEAHIRSIGLPYTIVRPGGLVAIYEHNPLNPLTRWAVSRCAFDADAVLLGRRELARLARGAGLELVMQSYIVFFPSRAPLFSTIERGLGWLPLGAQHGMAARK